MRARHIIEGAVAQILQAAGDSGGRMVLHGGDIDDLGESVSHYPRHIRTILPLAEKSSLAINVRIVAGVGQSVFDAHHADSAREQNLVASDIDLVFVAVVHDD